MLKLKKDFNKLEFNQLNQHFVTSDSIDGSTKLNTLTQISVTSASTFPSLTFSQFTVCDVKNNILDSNSDVVGADSISRKIIMPIIDIVAPIISSICSNYAFTIKVEFFLLFRLSFNVHPFIPTYLLFVLDYKQ